MEMYKIIFFDDNIRFIEDFVGTWFQLMKKIIILEKAGFNNVSYIPIGYVFPEIYFKRKQVDSSRTYYEQSVVVGFSNFHIWVVSLAARHLTVNQA